MFSIQCRLCLLRDIRRPYLLGKISIPAIGLAASWALNKKTSSTRAWEANKLRMMCARAFQTQARARVVFSRFVVGRCTGSPSQQKSSGRPDASRTFLAAPAAARAGHTTVSALVWHQVWICVFWTACSYVKLAHASFLLPYTSIWPRSLSAAHLIIFKWFASKCCTKSHQTLL